MEIYYIRLITNLFIPITYTNINRKINVQQVRESLKFWGFSDFMFIFKFMDKGLFNSFLQVRAMCVFLLNFHLLKFSFLQKEPCVIRIFGRVSWVSFGWKANINRLKDVTQVKVSRFKHRLWKLSVASYALPNVSICFRAKNLLAFP